MNTFLLPTFKHGLGLIALTLAVSLPAKTSYAQNFSFPANKNEALLQDRIASDAQVEKLLQQRELEHAVRLKKLTDDEQTAVRQINERMERARKEEAAAMAASRQRQQEALAVLDAELNAKRAGAQKEHVELLSKMEAEKNARLKSIQNEEDSVKDVSSKKIETLAQNEVLVIKAHNLKMTGLEREAQVQQERIDTANQAYLKLSGAIATAQETLQSLNTRITELKLEDIAQTQILERNIKSRQALLDDSLKRANDADAQYASERALRVATALNEEQKTLKDSAARVAEVLAKEEVSKKEALERITTAEEKARTESMTRIKVLDNEEAKTVSESKTRIEQLLLTETTAKKDIERRIALREQEEKEELAKISTRQSQAVVELEKGMTQVNEKIKALDSQYANTQTEYERLYAAKKQSRDQEALAEAQDHNEKMKALREKNLAQRKTLEDINAKNEAAVNNRLQQMLSSETERQEQVTRRKQQDETYLKGLAEKIAISTQTLAITNKELDRLTQELELLQNEKQARKLKLCTPDSVKARPVPVTTKTSGANLSQDGKTLPIITVTPDETVVPNPKVN